MYAPGDRLLSALNMVADDDIGRLVAELLGDCCCFCCAAPLPAV